MIVNYHISGSAFEFFPTETHFGLFSLEDGSMAEIPQQYPFCGPWGELVVENVPIRDNLPMPTGLEMTYLSVVEEKFYYMEIPINPQEMGKIFECFSKITSKTPYNIIVGMTPYGGVSLWLGNTQKQLLLGWLRGNEIELPMLEFLPQQPDMPIHDYCMDYINNDQQVKENLEKNGLPPRGLFDNYMRQFSYKYEVKFEHWDVENKEWKDYGANEIKPEFDYIDEALYDGTYDKMHDGGLMEYHEAGKPKKLALQWHIKKSDYSAYLWFDDMKIRDAFEQFYTKYPEAKMDFVFHIDTENKVFQLSFNCEEAEEPMLLSEDAYQMIVFKSKFEYYRTPNYNQPRGAWIW